MKVKGQKLKICAKKARAANNHRVAFFPKIATRWIYFIHIFRQLLVPNLSKSEKKSSVLALVPYYIDYFACSSARPPEAEISFLLVKRVDTWLCESPTLTLTVTPKLSDPGHNPNELVTIEMHELRIFKQKSMMYKSCIN